jgi:hypothetical protein
VKLGSVRRRRGRSGGGFSRIIARENMGKRGMDTAGEVPECGRERAPRIGHGGRERMEQGGKRGLGDNSRVFKEAADTASAGRSDFRQLQEGWKGRVYVIGSNQSSSDPTRSDIPTVTMSSVVVSTHTGPGPNFWEMDTRPQI